MKIRPTERGQALVIIALALVGLAAFAALIVHAQVNSPYGENLRNQAAEAIEGGQFAQPTPQKSRASNDSKYCGEDMKVLYAYWLLDQTIASIERPMLLGGSNAIPPIGQGVDPYKGQANAIDQSLRGKNCYKYEETGSVFMDYKLMRDAKYGIGQLSKWQSANFTAEMSTSEAFAKCLAEVATWWP